MRASDKQFLERELRELVAEIVEMDPEKITSEASFVEDLGMDSMMALEILASIEKKYKIKIPERYLTELSTLTNLLEITKKIVDEEK